MRVDLHMHCMHKCACMCVCKRACAHMCMHVHSIGTKTAGKALVCVLVGQGLDWALSSSCTCRSKYQPDTQ